MSSSPQIPRGFAIADVRMHLTQLHTGAWSLDVDVVAGGGRQLDRRNFTRKQRHVALGAALVYLSGLYNANSSQPRPSQEPRR